MFSNQESEASLREFLGSAMSAVFLLLGGSKQENKSKQERGRRDTTLMRDFQSSFAEIARLLSEFFRDLDVVPSDVLAGLILLRQRQQAARQQIISQVSIRLNTSQYKQTFRGGHS